MTLDPQQPDEKLPIDRRLANLKKGKPFVKGYDPRRNMKAVPKETTLIREKMRKIAAEVIGEGTEAEMTRFEAMLRQFFTSRNPAHNKLALQVLDPKILQEHVDVTSDGEKINAQKVDDGRFDRAISTLAEALREVVSRKGDEQNSAVDTPK